MSILSEPRKPDCDVCDWATAYHYAHKMNLCKADFEIVTKVAESEQQRIIKLLEYEITRLEEQGAAQGPGWMRAGISNCKHTIALIKGEK